MKIICIGHNYDAHNREMAWDKGVPAIFMKPDTALIKNGSDVYIPDFTNDFQYEIELVLRICKVGKSINSRFARRYYQEIGLGVDFTARDIQKKCKEKGEPWEIAKAFDHSALLSTDFIPTSEFPSLNDINFYLKKNGEIVQHGNSCNMIMKFDDIVAYVSSYFTLKIGDVIFTGTPAGVGKLSIGDELSGFIGEREMLKAYLK